MMPPQRSAPGMLVLRLRMSAGAQPLPLADTVTGQVKVLDPGARPIVLQLGRGDDVLGEWRFTLKNLNVPVDPEALINLEERFSGAGPAFQKIAAAGARALSDWFPSVVKQTTLNDLRQKVSMRPSLPLDIVEDIEQLLNTADKGRQVVWLELAEPLGPLPLLPWEPILRDAVGVPIVRLSGQLLDAVSPKRTLDVLVVCTTGRESVRIRGRSIAQLCEQVLAALPEPHRCVLHVFADESHREDVEKAFRSARLPFHEDATTEPRGVMLYRLPSQEERDGYGANAHHWGQWMRDRLAGIGIDVIHVVTEGGFPGLRPSLAIAPFPWIEPAMADAGSAPIGTRLRYVGAAEMTEFVRTFGAWGVVFSSTTSAAQRAQRSLSFDLAKSLPGAFAVHDLDGDPSARASRPLYAFLSGGSEQSYASGAIPDSPFLSLQCHPGRLNPELGRAWLEEKLGADFANASESVRASMEKADATPAWLGVVQRQIEQSANSYLASTPTSESDRAVQQGVAAALKSAMDLVARHSKLE